MAEIETVKLGKTMYVEDVEGNSERLRQKIRSGGCNGVCIYRNLLLESSY